MKSNYLSVIFITLVISGALVSSSDEEYAEIRSLLGKLLQGDRTYEEKVVDTVKKAVSQEKAESDKTVKADDEKAVEQRVEEKSETREQPVEKEQSLRELLQELLKDEQASKKEDVVSGTKQAEKKELDVAEKKEEKVSEVKTKEKKNLEVQNQKEDEKISELKTEEKKGMEDQKKEKDVAVDAKVVAVDTEKRNEDQKEEHDAASDTLMTSLRALLQKYDTKAKVADKTETVDKKESRAEPGEKTLEERARDHPVEGGESTSNNELSGKAVEKKETNERPVESTINEKVHEERSEVSDQAEKNVQDTAEKKYSVLRGLLEKYLSGQTKRVELDTPAEKSKDLVEKNMLKDELTSTKILKLRNLAEQLFDAHQESQDQEKLVDSRSNKIQQIRALLHQYLDLNSKEDQTEKDLRELEMIRNKKSKELKEYEAKLGHLRELAKAYKANVQEQEKRESHTSYIENILSHLSKEEKLRMIRQLILNRKSTEEDKAKEVTQVKTEEKKSLLDQMHSLDFTQKRELVELLRILKDRRAQEETQEKEKKTLENLAAGKMQEKENQHVEQKREGIKEEKKENIAGAVEKESSGAVKEKRAYAKLRALIESFAS